MKKVYLIILLFFIIMLALIFLIKPADIVLSIEMLTRTTTSTTTLPTTTTTTTLGESNITNATNETFLGGGSYESPTAPAINASKVLTLEIIDICQGKMGDVFAVSEGMRMCLNQKYPYYIGMQVEGNNLTTWLYNVSWFNQSYDLSNETTIYYIFVEDVSSVTKDIQQFYMIPNNTCLYLGEYTLHTIWYRNPVGEMEIIKIIAALPIKIDKTAISKTNWEEIKIYLKTYERDFFLGNLFFIVNN